MTRAEIEIGGIRIGNKDDEQSQQSSSTNSPFHSLILGNFSGNHSQPPSFKPRAIDRDNFDEVMLAIAPTLTICPTEDQSQSIHLTFKELEDFEPDALYTSLNVFSELRTLRRKLSNNATFETAAREINAWQEISQDKNNRKDSISTQFPEFETEITEGGSLLDSLLSETEHRQEEQITNAGDNLAKTLIQQVVAPYILPGTHPKQAELVANIDNSISGLMNSILHNPDFQALESSWRSLYLSVKTIKTDTKLKLFIVNTTKQSLIDNLEGHDLKSTTTYKKLIEPFTSIAGCKPWSLIVGDYYFGDSNEDLLFLEKIGLLAQESNATFVGAAKPELIGGKNLGEEPDVDTWNNQRDEKYLTAWSDLRSLKQSSHIALTFPRILSRLPYGEKTKSIESFSFEEMSGSEHDKYLWGNSAYSLLILIAESYDQYGWQFTPGKNNELSNLPAHSFEQDDDTELKPCAETYLTERSAEKLLENGLLPIWSILRSDSIRVGPFTSIHSTNQLIQGRWLS